jgi:hypothetical protein
MPRLNQFDTAPPVAQLLRGIVSRAGMPITALSPAESPGHSRAHFFALSASRRSALGSAGGSAAF